MFFPNWNILLCSFDDLSKDVSKNTLNIANKKWLVNYIVLSCYASPH